MLFEGQLEDLQKYKVDYESDLPVILKEALTERIQWLLSMAKGQELDVEQASSLVQESITAAWEPKSLPEDKVSIRNLLEEMAKIQQVKVHPEAEDLICGAYSKAISDLIFSTAIVMKMTGRTRVTLKDLEEVCQIGFGKNFPLC